MKFKLVISSPFGRTFILALATCVLFIPAGNCVPAPKQELKTVEKVDLSRYVGQWYEIARYPNRFERDCATDVTATYATLPDGKIQIIKKAMAVRRRREEMQKLRIPSPMRN
jgi:apolipoprotein D and lipocalin family protein